MPEPRDRLVRRVDIAAAFSRRRVGGLGILADDSETNRLFGTPMRQWPAAAAAGRGGSATRSARVYSTPMSTRRRRSGRSTSSVLPSWYPRTPLRDITAIVGAIETRRTSLRDTEGQGTPSLISQRERVADLSSVHATPLKNSISIVSPNVGTKHLSTPASKVRMTILKFTNQNTGSSEFLTPQKKLLNSIEDVEKVVMEDLQKQKRTPSAKRAEREKRVRTLMSMR